MKISVANNRFTKKWKNTEITYLELKQKCQTTIRTTETVQEYSKMKKADRDEAKDVGGLVGGHLANGSRKKGSVLSRSMGTMDLDYATVDVIDVIRDATIKSFLYSTHSHTPEKPRYRWFYEFTREVTPEEYEAVTRMVAREIGIDYFDDTTYEPNRLMYWPSTPANGEFVFEEFEGDLIDPDEYLAKYDNWRDVSTWPHSSRQSEVIKSDVKKQADPLTKDGIVGVFCRTFTIHDVIEKFLSDVYEPSAMEGRYDYIPADSSAGVEIFDDKFAYSHHATDPASGHLLNSWDLVRLHKFGDEKNSFKEMSDFAVKQDHVKTALLKEKQAEAVIDFDVDWTKQLKFMPRSKCLENSVWNLMLILNNDPDFKNIALNDLVGRIQITGDVPWERPKDNKFWRDADTAQIKALIDMKYETFSSRNHDVAFTKVVEDRHFHPLREWLDVLPNWDKQKRLENIYIDYLGANNTKYVKAASRKTYVAAVARIYEPGIKFDSIAVLIGPQGCGKSTLFSKLGRGYYSDSLSLMDMKDKAGAEKLQGYWILELGELAGLRKTDIEVVKAFVSRTDDIYRPSYGRTVESHPRQSIIVGTTNSESGFLRDITGNRRFWPIKVSGNSKKKSWDLTDEEVIQIWAEAKYLYEKDEPLYLNMEESSEALSEQIEAMETDERQGMVEEYLNTLLPDDWNTKDIYERRSFLSDSLSSKGTIVRTTVSNAEIWCECFCRNLSDLKPSDSYAIAALMTKVDGWHRTEKMKRQQVYGKQRIYEKL